MEAGECGHGRVEASGRAPPNATEGFSRADATQRVGGALLQDWLQKSEEDSDHPEGDTFAGIIARTDNLSESVPSIGCP